MANQGTNTPQAVDQAAEQPLVETQVSAPRSAEIITSGQNSVKTQVNNVLDSGAADDIKKGAKELLLGGMVAPLEAVADIVEGAKEARAAKKEAEKHEAAGKVGLLDKVRKMAGRDISDAEKKAAEARANGSVEKAAAARAVQKEANKKALNGMMNAAPNPFMLVPGASLTIGGQINQFRGAKNVFKGTLKLPKAVFDATTGETREDNWIVPDNGNWVEMGDRGIVPANNSKWHVNVDKKQYVARQTVESAIGPDGKPISIDRLMPVEPLYTTQKKAA